MSVVQDTAVEAESLCPPVWLFDPVQDSGPRTLLFWSRQETRGQRPVTLAELMAELAECCPQYRANSLLHRLQTACGGAADGSPLARALDHPYCALAEEIRQLSSVDELQDLKERMERAGYKMNNCTHRGVNVMSVLEKRLAEVAGEEGAGEKKQNG